MNWRERGEAAATSAYPEEEDVEGTDTQVPLLWQEEVPEHKGTSHDSPVQSNGHLHEPFVHAP